ncbi:ArsR/SmtB family transcription factor [Carnobacterium funditum]|uniref:ArsR/SmtB family transcription factor n=1 Tax=Carnobacterium funditum TaxID=2752 RepID=UPI0005575DBB|nr:metalloregulator ArsR/SmtB family transcription factor [Carnobacterium funditum]
MILKGEKVVENVFKVLGDQNRLRIINLLRKEALCVCEIEVILDTTQSNVSRHLTRLRNEKIVIFEKKSQWTYYQIDPAFIKYNKLLYDYLIEKMETNDTFIRDQEKLSSYTKSDLTCDNIAEINKIK